jgi:hypothetical protein
VGLQPPRPSSLSEQSQHNTSRKKKSFSKSACESSSRSTTRSPKWGQRQQSGPSRGTAHDLVEKKYRLNLNKKMVALRDSIPSLRTVAKQGSDEADSQPARKLNKVGLHNAVHAGDSTLCGS